MNKCLVKKRVKYEGWKVALAYFAKDSFMFSFDLKSGYHHVDISQEHQTFLARDFPGEHLIPGMNYFMSLPSSRLGCPLPLIIYKTLKTLRETLEVTRGVHSHFFWMMVGPQCKIDSSVALRRKL